MNSKKVCAFLVFCNVVTIVAAWFLLNSQSAESQAVIDRLQASIEKTKIAEEPNPLVKPQASIKTVAAPKTVQIPIYTKAAGLGRIFTTFKDRGELIVISSEGEWAQVISTRGFPVWVRGDLVESFSKGYVTIVVKAANARTSPGTSNSALLGQLPQGEILKVNKKQGQWFRVWSPIKFKAWVKLSDFE